MKSKPRDTTETTVPSGEAVQRLSLALPADLHRRIKAKAAKRGTRMIQDVIDILKEHYPPDADE